MTSQDGCRRCGSAMEAGFIVDEGYGTRKIAAWIEGEPVPSLWSGVKTSGRRQLPIETWRCTGCGLLESFAPA